MSARGPSWFKREAQILVILLLAPFAIAIAIGLFMAATFPSGPTAKDKAAQDITLADPPSGATENPHKPNALMPPGRSTETDRLYQLGLDRATALDPAAGYWQFKECVAFNPDHALCQREFGQSAASKSHGDDVWAREALPALRRYLELEPDAADREKIAAIVADLEAGRPPTRLDDLQPLNKPLVFGAWADPERDAPDRQLGIADTTLHKSADRARQLRLNGKPKKAAEKLAETLEAVPDGTSELDIAVLWCQLGLAYAADDNPKRAMDCFYNGIEQFPLFPDCHYFLCLVLPDSEPEARNACERYMKVAPKEPYSERAQKRLDNLPARPE